MPARLPGMGGHRGHLFQQIMMRRIRLLSQLRLARVMAAGPEFAVRGVRPARPYPRSR